MAKQTETNRCLKSASSSASHKSKGKPMYKSPTSCASHLRTFHFDLPLLVRVTLDKFPMPRATARLIALLQGGRAQGAIIHCKNAVDLFCGRPRARRSQDGTCSPPWRLLGCPKRPQEKVLKIRGGHQDGRKLDSLLFYRLK